jgi:hypothetical protein
MSPWTGTIPYGGEPSSLDRKFQTKISDQILLLATPGDLAGTSTGRARNRPEKKFPIQIADSGNRSRKQSCTALHAARLDKEKYSFVGELGVSVGAEAGFEVSVK